MSFLFRMQEVQFAHAGQSDAVLNGVSWELNPGQKVGVLGANGAGKSTLLGLVQGLWCPEQGVIERNFTEAFVLLQEDLASGDGDVLNYFLLQEPALWELHQQIKQQELAGWPDPLHYANLTQRFLEAGGFEHLRLIEQAVVHFGFEPAVLSRSLTALSGGERRLLCLAAGLVRPKALWLLDEPTNYLDLTASERLVKALRQSRQTMLLVSHDRWFLDEVCSHTLELERGQLRLYSGNYSVFDSTKAQEHQEALRKKEKLEREIVKLREIERTYTAWGHDREADKYRPVEGKKDKGYIGAKAAKLQGRALQAKERMALRIAQLEEAKPWVDKERSLAFKPVQVPQGRCLQAQGLALCLGTKTVLHDLSFSLEWGQKLWLKGRNGSGKSSLIAVLLGHINPKAGEVFWSGRARIGYLPQHSSGLDPQQRVVDGFSLSQRQEAQTLLGSLRVAGDAFERPLGQLSLGQQRKVALVQLLLQAPNVLILDEPTTHLDYQSVEMLEQALQNFAGSVVLCTHDRYLAQRVTQQVLALD